MVNAGLMITEEDIKQAAREWANGKIGKTTYTNYDPHQKETERFHDEKIERKLIEGEDKINYKDITEGMPGVRVQNFPPRSVATPEKLTATQDLLCRLASMAIGNGTFTLEKFLKYKPDIRKASSMEALGRIGKILMEEICGWRRYADREDTI